MLDFMHQLAIGIAKKKTVIRIVSIYLTHTVLFQ